ncbi:MAG: hypothetical protein ACJ8C4_18400 [Gemmataceae bacterium]
MSLAKSVGHILRTAETNFQLPIETNQKQLRLSDEWCWLLVVFHLAWEKRPDTRLRADKTQTRFDAPRDCFYSILPIDPFDASGVAIEMLLETELKEVPKSDPISQGRVTYNLGRLLREIESYETAYTQTRATADQYAAKASPTATWWYLQSEAYRWRPDLATMPGIHRIELICDRLFGSGISSESVRRLRAMVCDKLGLRSLDVADSQDLESVADLLENRKNVTLEAMQENLKDMAYHGLITLNEVNVGSGEKIQITGLSCKVIPGAKPTACPHANPPVPPTILLTIEKFMRGFCRLPDGRTIHWVGHEAGYRNQCPCYPSAPYAAPYYKDQWHLGPLAVTDQPDTSQSDRQAISSIRPDVQHSHRRAKNGNPSVQTRSWIQGDLDNAIREYKAERASTYPDLVAGVRRGNEGAQRSARRIFGRNAIAKALGVRSKAMVSGSPVWREIAEELGLAGKNKSKHATRKKIGIEIAIEEHSSSTSKSVGDTVIRNETIALIQKVVSKREADQIIDKLVTGAISDDEARQIADLMLNSED